MNIADVLTEHARKRPDHPAIEDGERVISYADLDTGVDGAAANLQSADIASGDVVGVMLPDSAEYLIALLALARVGAVMVAIENGWPAEEKRRAADSVNMRAVIATDESEGIGDARALPIGGICQPATSSFERQLFDGSHPLAIVQSSGTTGTPKSFVWSHDRMLIQAPRHQFCLGLSGEDRYLAAVRMSFFWEREICFVMFSLGATVIVSRAQNVNDLVANVNANRVSFLALTPAHLTALLSYPSERRPLFPSVQAMVVGSAPLAHERRVLVRQRLTPHFYEQLGTNEAGLLILGAPADQDARPEAIGRVVPGVKAQVLDEDGRPLPPGEVGLVGFRGEGFPSEYLGDPDATERAFRDGWFYPGDLAAIDADGFFIFKGRKDDIINNQGAKFYPIEVEKTLLTNPAVTEAAVFGWPHSQLGEVAVAYVVTKEKITAPELGRFCRQHIAGYKVPNWIVFVNEMPKNATGKILKTRLRRIFGETRGNRPF